MGKVASELAEKVLAELRGHSGTGPDQLPAQILKELSRVLSGPVSKLVNLILEQGRGDGQRSG